MPIITGLQAFLQDLQGWMLILAIPFVAIQAITLGYSLVNKLLHVRGRDRWQNLIFGM